MIKLKYGIFNFLYRIHCILFNDNSNFSKRDYLIFSLGIRYSKIKNTKQHIPIAIRYPLSSLVSIKLSNIIDDKTKPVNRIK